MLLYKLGYTTCLTTIAFIRFYIRFLVYDHYYIIPALPLVFYSSSLLLLSYHIMSSSAWYHLLCIYLLLHAYAHDTVFNACL